MPISYPIEIPVEIRGEVEFEWAPESMVAIQDHEFTGATTAYKWPGQKRRGSVTVGAMTTIAQAKAWEVFMLKLNIREGTFYMQDPIAFAHRGSITTLEAASVAVNGADQVGVDLITDGWPAGETGLLLAGDFIQVGGRLRQVLNDVNSDSSGGATIQIWPHAQNDIEDDEEIIIGEDAKGIFRIVDPAVFSWDSEKIREGFSFTCEEAFGA